MKEVSNSNKTHHITNCEREIIEFSILKEILYNNIIPKPNNYNIDSESYAFLVKDMVNKSYLNADRVLFNILGYVELENEGDLVTSIGKEFIESHEGWNNIYNDLNDLNKLFDKEK